MDRQYEVYEKAFVSMFRENKTEEDLERIRAFTGNAAVENTSIADYVWLPFRFDGEMAYLDWKDEWRIEDYE